MSRKYACLLCLILLSSEGFSKEICKTKKETVDSIFVSKSKKEMTLFMQGKCVKKYKVAVGENAIGHKQKQGDNKTPEGLYFIYDKNPNSKYYKNLGISYPNEKDKRAAKSKGFSPGGDIKLHGYADEQGHTDNRSLRYSYTWGCVAVTNAEMDEIYRLVKIGASILIAP